MNAHIKADGFQRVNGGLVDVDIRREAAFGRGIEREARARLLEVRDAVRPERSVASGVDGKRAGGGGA